MQEVCLPGERLNGEVDGGDPGEKVPEKRESRVARHENEMPSGQFVKIDRKRRGQNIPLCHDDEDGLVPQIESCGALNHCWPGLNHDIKFVAPSRLTLRRRIRVHEFDTDVRTDLQESVKQLREAGPRCDRGQTDAKHAILRGSSALHRQCGLRCLCQDLPRRSEQTTAGESRPHAGMGPGKQGGAHGVLDVANTPTQRRLLHAQSLCGPPEAALFGCGENEPPMFQQEGIQALRNGGNM